MGIVLTNFFKKIRYKFLIQQSTERLQLLSCYPQRIVGNDAISLRWNVIFFKFIFDRLFFSSKNSWTNSATPVVVLAFTAAAKLEIARKNIQVALQQKWKKRKTNGLLMKVASKTGSSQKSIAYGVTVFFIGMTIRSPVHSGGSHCATEPVINYYLGQVLTCLQTKSLLLTVFLLHPQHSLIWK